jgi:hypothetical protein
MKLNRQIHGNLAAGDFLRLLVSLNPRLRIIAGSEGRKVAGLYYWEHARNTEHNITPHWRFIMGVQPGWMPERSIMYSDGVHYSHGWREVLATLAGQGLVKIPSAFGGNGRVLHYGKVKRLDKRSPFVLSE